MQKQLLIAAGGQGLRMHPEHLLKPFVEIAGRPLLLHTLDAFLDHDPGIKIVIVIPSGKRELWDDICSKHHFSKKHLVEEGGPARFHSVKNGLKHIDADGLVAIHDGVRPLVSKSLISHAFDVARKFGNAIPAIAPFDSIRLAEHASSKPLTRTKVRIVQTPQCFRASLIKDAYNVQYDASFTDDASVLEARGERIYLVDGERENIKVTTHSDLLMVAALLEQKSLTK